MTVDRWRQLSDLIGGALAQPTEAREGWLRDASHGDEALFREARTLLLHEKESFTLIRESMGEAQWDLLVKRVEPGSRFGPYRIKGVLGQGGMGAVYEAVRDDGNFSQRVAIKIVKWEMDTDTVRDRFRQERQILAGLEHPHIARLLDGGESEGGIPYLVLEFVSGVPINEYSRDLSQDHRLRLFLKVCEAVEFAHRNLVIHRDLKPANILVTPQGDPKLLDFGIAKLVDPSATVTQTGLMALTPDYASPEQVRGHPITTASDVYSLGVILYLMLTGRRPYVIDKLTAGEIDRVICEQAPTPPGLGDELDHILLMALRKEPERRYGSVEQLADDIERYLDHRPVRARPDTVLYRTKKFVRRNWLALGAAMAVLLALAGGIVLSQQQAHRAERRFRQVRELANVFLFDLDGQIRDLPGSTKARETLVRTALRYLDTLAAESADDPDLQRELGIAYRKVAFVQGQPGNPSLGHTAEALVSYRKALDVLQAAARTRNSDETAEEIGETLLSLADVEVGTGNTSGARADLSKGLGIVRGISDAESPRRLRLVAALDNRLVSVLLNLSLPDQAPLVAAEAVSSARLLVAEHNSADAYKLLGDSYIGSAWSERQSGNLSASVADLNNATKALEQAEKLEPGRSSTRQSLYWAYESLGNTAGNPTEANLGDVKTAIESLSKGLALAEEAAAADPNNRTAQGQLAAASLNLADTLTLADHAGAIQYYKRVLGIMDKLCADDSANLTNQYMRAMTQVSYSNVLLLERSAQAALPQAASAMATFERLASADPNRIYYARALVGALRLSGEVKLALGEDQAALTALQAALDRIRQVSQTHAADILIRVDLATALRSVGHFYEASKKLGDARKARSYYAEEVEIWQQWPARSMSTAYDQGKLRTARAAVERVSRNSVVVP